MGSMGQRAKGRNVLGAGSALQLREPEVSYLANSGLENEDIGVENGYFWNTIIENAIT